MQIDVTQTITDLDGRAMRLATGIDDDGKPIVVDASLRAIIVNALWNPMPGDEKLPVDTKIRHEELARLVHQNDTVDLEAEDVTLIKARINNAYAHVGIVAGARRLIDPPKLKADA